MEIINQELLNKTKEFLTNISKKDRVCIIHHTDPDGVCAGAILSKIIERLREKKIDLRHNQKSTTHALTNETLELIKKKEINKLLITDIAPEENPQTLQEASKHVQILILDHHQIKNEVKSEKIIFYKPQLIFSGIEPSRYCSAKLVYDLGMMLTDISDLDWIATIGIIGDVAYPQWHEFVDKTLQKYKVAQNKDIFKTELGKCASIINSVDCFGEKHVKKSYKAVYCSKSYKDIFNSELKKYDDAINKEIHYWTAQMEKKAEIYPELELIYYEIQPKHTIKSVISTVISFKYPEKTVIVALTDKEEVNASARRQDCRMKMNELMSYATKNIPGAFGGGHIPASGATVPLKHYKEFKRRVMKFLREHNPNT